MSYLVYKIYCKDTSITDVYIGSSKNFVSRKYMHKSYCNNENTRYYNFKLYVFIRENGGFDNWEFEVLEEDIQDKVQALVREKYYIQFFSASLNCRNPFRNDGETKEYHKEYYEKNKEEILERQNEKNTCDICGSVISRNYMSKHKKSKKCINSNK